jgi:hypothetical protein
MEGTTWSVEACLVNIRNQRYGQLANQYNQKPMEENAGRLISISTVYVEDAKNPTPFSSLTTPLLPSSKTWRDVDKARKATFPSWQRQLRCRYRRLLTPWQMFFKTVLLLTSVYLCSVSVSLRYYLCYIVHCILHFLLTNVKLNKHSIQKKKVWWTV